MTGGFGLAAAASRQLQQDKPSQLRAAAARAASAHDRSQPRAPRPRGPAECLPLYLGECGTFTFTYSVAGMQAAARSVIGDIDRSTQACCCHRRGRAATVARRRACRPGSITHQGLPRTRGCRKRPPKCRWSRCVCIGCAKRSDEWISQLSHSHDRAADCSARARKSRRARELWA